MCTNKSIVVFDIETTGCNPQKDCIIEIGAVKIVDNLIVDEWNELINPNIEIPENIQKLTGITQSMVCDRPTLKEILPQFVEFCSESDIMGHNIIFDYSFIKTNCIKMGLSFDKYALDTLQIAKKLLPDIPSRRLVELCKFYNIDLSNAHRAKYDARATYELYIHLKNNFYSENRQLFLPTKIEWNPPDEEMATQRQKNYLLSLVNKHYGVLEKPIDEFTKAEASKAIDGILKQLRTKYN